MLAMNVFRLYTHWLPFLFFACLLIIGFWIDRNRLIASDNSVQLTEKQRSLLTIGIVVAGILFACVRIPYLLEGHFHHLVGPVVYDDTWHFQEINSLVNSLRYPAHFSLVPQAYFSLYYASWMLMAALYLAVPLAGFTVKAAFAIGCAIYQISICLMLLHVAMAKARNRVQLYWAVYLVGCWAGLESIFSLLYYLRRDASWLVDSQMPIHFPIFANGMIWAVHHLSAAAALILCWYIWDRAESRSGPTTFACALLIGFAFYGSVFVFLGAIPLAIFAAWVTLRTRWKSTLAIAGLSVLLIWPMLWLYLGKSSDVRFLFPFIANIHALFPAAGLTAHNGAESFSGMGSGFILFLVYLGLNFLPYAIAMALYGWRLSMTNRIFSVLASAFLVSTFFLGFQEGDNYASRGYLVPIIVLAWICAGVLPSIRFRKWAAVLLLLGAFGSIHEVFQTYKHAIQISRVPCAGKYDSEILAINRNRKLRIVDAHAWRNTNLIYNVEKFVAGGKAKLVTADRQLECPGPRGPWSWQQIPDPPGQ